MELTQVRLQRNGCAEFELRKMDQAQARSAQSEARVPLASWRIHRYSLVRRWRALRAVGRVVAEPVALKRRFATS